MAETKCSLKNKEKCKEVIVQWRSDWSYQKERTTDDEKGIYYETTDAGSRISRSKEKIDNILKTGVKQFVESSIDADYDEGGGASRGIEAILTKDGTVIYERDSEPRIRVNDEDCVKSAIERAGIFSEGSSSALKFLNSCRDEKRQNAYGREQIEEERYFKDVEQKLESYKKTGKLNESYKQRSNAIDSESLEGLSEEEVRAVQQRWAEEDASR